MTRYLLIVLAALQLGAATNSVKIYDRTGSEQINRPITLARAFVRGEIASFARPIVNGTPATVWQCDKKKAWPDGSLAFALVSFKATIPANGSITVTFANSTNPCSSGNQAACNAAGLDKTGMLNFNSGNWGAAIETTFNDGASGFTHTFNGKTILSDGHFTYWLRGPVATEVIAEDASPARVYDAGASCATGCAWLSYAASATTVDVAANTITVVGHGLVNGERVLWHAGMPGNISWDWVYWVVNATANTFQVASSPGGAPRSITGTGSGTATVYHNFAHSTWTNDTVHRSLHPIFGFRFYSGWSGVRVHYELENEWESQLQDQHYDVVLKSGGALATTEYSLAGVTQYARTDWRKVFWDGAQPGAVRIDHNLAYLVTTGTILPYDTTLSPSSTAYSNEVAYYNDRASGGEPLVASLKYLGLGQSVGSYLADMWTTGGRPDIGPLTRWETLCLYAMSNATYGAQLWDVVQKNADITGLFDFHLRESVTGKYFVDLNLDGNPANDNVSAFGHVLSRDARPTAYTNTWDNRSAGGNLDAPLAPLSITNGISLNLAHQPSMVWVAWLLSGDWYYQREQQQIGAYALAYGTAGTCRGYCGGDAWAFIDFTGNLRRVGWGLREAAHAAWASTTGSYEETYFEHKLASNAAVWEGYLDVTAGNYHDTTTTSRWYWGHNTLARGHANPLGIMNDTISVLNATVYDTTVTATVTAPWQHNFCLTTFRVLVDLGYHYFDHVRAKASTFIIGMIDDPNSNPWYSQRYYDPASKVNDGGFFTSWADFTLGWAAGNRSPTGCESWYCSGADSYGDYTRGVTALSVDLPGGIQARQWAVAHYTMNVSDDPRWGFQPIPPAAAQPGKRSSKFSGLIHQNGVGTGR